MKTTLLDAVEYALTPRWNLPITDSDFYDCDVSKAVKIEVTLTELPKELLADTALGLDLRGWHPVEGLKDEPEDGCSEAVTICLKIDQSLEPKWTVITDRNPDGRSISSEHRALLGVARLDQGNDRDLLWTRGSALARVTEQTQEVKIAVAAAHRQAREAIDQTKLVNLQKAASHAQELAKAFGVQPRHQFEPRLQPELTGRSGLSLHDGNIPLSCAGLATRRLTSLALQRRQVAQSAILLVDEIELGLEPYRIRGLIENLAGTDVQVLMTSHSPIAVLCSIHHGKVMIVRSEAGKTNVRAVPSELYATIREAPEAILSKKIVVCEGATEQGLFYAINKIFMNSLAIKGVSLVDGGGNNAVKRACVWADLGFHVAIFRDSDKLLSPSQMDDLRYKNIQVIAWSSPCATEKRICDDLPLVALDELIENVVSIFGEEQIRQVINNSNVDGLEIKPSVIVKNGSNEDQVRKRVVLILRKHKGEVLGRKVGEVIAKYFSKILDTQLAKTLKQVGDWIDAAGNSESPGEQQTSTCDGPSGMRKDAPHSPSGPGAAVT